MLTGKMTATWLILITVVGIIVVPLMIIYFTEIRPYDLAHPGPRGDFILGLIPLVPHISIPGFVSGHLI